MDSKHIERDYSAHKKSVIRPYDEYVKLEIFSFDPKFTSMYLREDNSLKKGTNCEATSWKSWSCYKSKDKQNDMVFKLKYNCLETGEYRIDLVYEQNDYIHDGKTNTGKDLLGHLTIGNEYDKDVKFDGENNIIKRKTVFVNLIEGGKTLEIEVPHNCYFYGVIVRKVPKFVGDNYYGDSLGNEVGNMVLTGATVTNSDNVKPTELSAEVFYDDAFECPESPSGFYIDYHDECNFYVRDNTGEIIQIFGGYVSSILPDSDLKKLTISCADRLIDGQNKYVLDKLTLGGGSTDLKEDEYPNELTKDFDGYAQVLKYLCDIHEVTLKSNISKKYTVDGESFHDGFTVTFGKKKKVKKITASNGTTKVYKNHIMIRNNPKSDKKQTFTLYEASKYSKKPPEITDFPYFHVVYGIAEPKTSWTTETTETVESEGSDTTASGKWSKCGRSSDGKLLMSICQPSAGRTEGYSYNTIYKTVFENKCPYCGAELVWDRGISGADCVHCGGYSHSKVEWGDISEGEVTCSSCCADFCGVTGWDKDGSFSNRLKTHTKPVKSSKKEQDELHQGKYSGGADGTVSADDIFKEITQIAFKYKYNLDYGDSSYSAMKNSGVGECWAFSDLIFTELKRHHISCRIKNYATSMSNNHRSVQYKDKNGQWANFPYREYGWNTKYNNMLNDTDGVWGGTTAKEYKGNNIDGATSTKSTQTQKTTITHTKGYDKSKPFQGFFRITYSVQTGNEEITFKSKTHNLDIKFTQNPTTARSLSGMKTYWVNDTIKKATLQLSNNQTLKQYFELIHGEGCRIYLQSIRMIAPKVKATVDSDGKKKREPWYTIDKSTDDNSSCKLDLYQITFDDNQGADSGDLTTCGKSINSVMKDIVGSAGYHTYMTYKTHRKDDRINFRVINNTSEQYTATEGDNNNILSWNSISYSPVSALYNMSMQVFKTNEKDNTYKYIDTRDGKSILEYGEQCTLQTSNEPISEKEAYFNATFSDKYNPTQTYTYTITVPNYPNITIGDYVKVVANAKKLNSVKEVKSVKMTFDSGKIPRIQTQIGLDELAPNIQLQKTIRQLRESTKKESTEFSSSATPVTNEMYYQWDK